MVRMGVQGLGSPARLSIVDRANRFFVRSPSSTQSPISKLTLCFCGVGVQWLCEGGGGGGAAAHVGI